MKLGIIAAVAENGVIGNKGKLPWERISEDMERFRRFTIGKPVIMGRITAQSLDKPLGQGRTNIVVTRGNMKEGFLVARSIEEALDMAKDTGADRVWSIGGKEIYESTINLADIMEITHVLATPYGDVRFPLVPWNEWEETIRIPRIGYNFVSYRRKI